MAVGIIIVFNHESKLEFCKLLLASIWSLSATKYPNKLIYLLYEMDIGNKYAVLIPVRYNLNGSLSYIKAEIDISIWSIEVDSFVKFSYYLELSIIILDD